MKGILKAEERAILRRNGISKKCKERMGESCGKGKRKRMGYNDICLKMSRCNPSLHV